jgi:hypothetical protein
VNYLQRIVGRPCRLWSRGRGARAEPFGGGMQDWGDTGRRRLELVERGVTPRREFAPAGLTVGVLATRLSPAVAVANQGMNGRVGVAEVTPIRIGAGVTGRADELPAAAGALEWGVRNQRLGWRGRPCRRVTEVSQFDQQPQEPDRQEQDPRSSSGLGRHGAVATGLNVVRVPGFSQSVKPA